jgi:hypothetical protein
MSVTNATKALVTFYPQIWADGKAVTGDDTEQFFVPIEDATNEHGNLLEDDTDASDRLRRHSNAPQRAKDWTGPFYVTVEPVATLEELDPDTYDIEALVDDTKAECEQEVPPPNQDRASTGSLSGGFYTIEYTPDAGDSEYTLSFEPSDESRGTVEIPIDENTVREIFRHLPSGGWDEDTILDMPTKAVEWRGADLSPYATGG